MPRCTVPATSPMSTLDSIAFSTLETLTQTERDDGLDLAGTMRFPAALVGPPGRVHGGFHPLVRTLPILGRVRGESAPPSRVFIDATLQKALPLDESVAFTGRYVANGDSYELTTRFLDSDRLIAKAHEPRGGELASVDDLARFRELFERAHREETRPLRVIGVSYRLSESAVILDLREPNAVADDSHLRKCIDADGAIGLSALATQLDAVGATAQGARMRHPHFTKHLSLAFDTTDLESGTPLVMIGDRTTLYDDVESDTPKVDIGGNLYGTVRAEVIACDASFTRCFGHGYVWSHPVDPSRFAGFEGMRKLREV